MTNEKVKNIDSIISTVNKEKYDLDKKRINELIKACVGIINKEKTIKNGFNLNRNSITFDEKGFKNNVKAELLHFCEDNSWTEVSLVPKDTAPKKSRWTWKNKLKEEDYNIVTKDGIIEDEEGSTQLINAFINSLKDYIAKQEWDKVKLANEEQRKLFVQQKLQDFLFTENINEKIAFRKIIEDAIKKNDNKSMSTLLRTILKYSKDPAQLLCIVGTSIATGNPAIKTTGMVASYIISYVLTNYGPEYLNKYIHSERLVRATLAVIVSFL